jgi:hypothetical protein
MFIGKFNTFVITFKKYNRDNKNFLTKKYFFSLKIFNNILKKKWVPTIERFYLFFNVMNNKDYLIQWE